MRFCMGKQQRARKIKRRVIILKMEEKLYDYMDWAEIEAVVYSEENHPRRSWDRA